MGSTKAAEARATELEESPLGWFYEMMFAQERGDHRRASQAGRELKRFGWDVKYTPPRTGRGEPEIAK